MRIALATSAWADGKDEELKILAVALDRLGATCSTPRWDDGRVDWRSFDAVVVRSTWDYPERPASFLRWARHVDERSTLLNPIGAVGWNIDKAYLQDLADAGVPVVPTTLCASGESWQPPSKNEYVIKPSVSNAARNTARYRPGVDDDRARAHVASLQDGGHTVLTQPYMHAVDRHGEISLVYFDGRYSHAARKTALLRPAGPLSDDLFFRADITGAQPTPAERACAELALDAITARFGQLLFARIDLLATHADNPVLLECELIEPLLFLDHHHDAVARLAAAILRRVRLADRPRGESA